MQAPLGYEQAALHEPRDSVSDPAYSIAEAKFADAPEEPLPGARDCRHSSNRLPATIPATVVCILDITTATGTAERH